MSLAIGSGHVLMSVRCATHPHDRLVILRCTRKLLAVLGTGRAAGPGPAADAQDWYASLLWLDRRKSLLLTHAATLFLVFVAGSARSGSSCNPTHQLVTELIEREIRREGLPPAAFGNLRSRELVLARTADRSVLRLRRMNDIAFLGGGHQRCWRPGTC